MVSKKVKISHGTSILYNWQPDFRDVGDAQDFCAAAKSVLSSMEAALKGFSVRGSLTGKGLQELDFCGQNAASHCVCAAELIARRLGGSVVD